MKLPAPTAPRSLSLKNQVYELRRLSPEDEAALIAFFTAHTADTLAARYGYSDSFLSPARAKRLATVDQERHLALGIFDAPEAGDALYAIGRYYLETARQAELGFLVRELKRRCGMASVLLHELALAAHERGITTFRVHVLHDNYPMRSFLIHYGPAMEVVQGYAALNYFLSTAAIAEMVPPAA